MFAFSGLILSGLILSGLILHILITAERIKETIQTWLLDAILTANSYSR
ncbi:unnamed protein product [marine sediment metagenome]|uniref:Uncharacterized protein n=1 Tax=marine sediment metagenome TaxID=412755 RepID=X1NBK9_9ZZZZ